MSAITNMFEAPLGPRTELVTELELTRSAGRCRTLEPRWWLVDVGVRSRVLNTSATAVPRPSVSDFHQGEFVTRAPLHLRLGVGLLDRGSASSRDWLVDLVSMRAYLFASSITTYVVGPASLAHYTKGESKSAQAKTLVHCQVSAGLWPLDTVHQRHGTPGGTTRAASCTMRVRVPAEARDVAVPIPPGARSLAIYDTTGSSSPWTWQLGAPAVEQHGRLALVDGQLRETALAPHFTHVAPAERFDEDRDVLLVFGVDL